MLEVIELCGAGRERRTGKMAIYATPNAGCSASSPSNIRPEIPGAAADHR
jgi:hypothetical protein